MKKTYVWLAILLGLLFYQNVVFSQSSEAFIHIAESGNIFGNLTRIDHPQLNENPNPLPVFVHRYNVGNTNVAYVNKKLGIWYQNFSNKWTIYNQDQSAFTPNSAYNVLIPGPDMHSFVHTSTLNNVTNDYTVLDHPAINNNPNATIIISDTYGTYHLPPVGLYYNNSSQRWRLFNLNGDNMVANKKFHIVVAQNGQSNYGAFRHVSAANNTTNNRTRLSIPAIENDPDALIFITQVWPQAGAINNNHVGVYFSNGKWAIYNEDNSKPMPANAAFNVIYFPSPSSVGIFENFSTSEQMTIFPNPLWTGQSLQITLSKEHKGDINLRLTNIAGQVVHQQTIQSLAEEKSIEWMLPFLKSGLYILSAESDGFVSTQKLIIK